MFRRKNNNSEEFINQQKNVKIKINQNLAHIVKELQKEFRILSAPAIQSESPLSQHLCSVLESAFIHGLKVSYYEKETTKSTSRNNFPKPQFWNLIIKVSHAETVSRVQALTYIATRIGKCRAWLRLTLNDSAVTSYLASILSNDQRSTLLHYYDQHALFLDQEQADIFLRYLQGVESVLFDLSYNSSMLNQWTKTPLELAGLVPPSTTAPLYQGLQASVENNNYTKTRIENGRTGHRASAPALYFSQSVPAERTRKFEIEAEHTEEPKEEDEESQDGPNKSQTNGEDVFPENDILHKRQIIKKKRRKKKLSFTGSGIQELDSWSSISSGESMASEPPVRTVHRNMVRHNSFCETPAISRLVKKRNDMSVKLTPTDKQELPPSSTPKKNYASDIPDGHFLRTSYRQNFRESKPKETLTPSRLRKNKNLNLGNRDENPKAQEATVGSVEPFNSFPPDVADVQMKSPLEGALDDSTSSQSSGRIDSKLNSQIPLSKVYKMSYVSPFSSSGSDEDKGREQTVTSSEQEARDASDVIDIYSNSHEQNDHPGEDLHLDLSPLSRYGNSLSRGGGWSTDQSAANTPLSASDTTSKSRVLSPVATKVKVERTEQPLKRNTSHKFSPSPSLKEVVENVQPEIFIRREGYLKKLSEKQKLWRKFWFVLRGTMVYVYKDKNTKDTELTIDLTEVISISNDTEHYGADIEITMNNGAVHHLAAENKHVTLDWASDFRQVITGPALSPKIEDSTSSGSYVDEYEVISVRNHLLSTTNTSWHASMLAHLARIANEKGLDSQNYQCADCASPIGIIYGPPRLCNFTGQYYCANCHSNDESHIPARMVHNWDFRKFKVARRSRTFLEQILTDPLIKVNESNQGIYRYIDEMGKVLQLRSQLANLKPYLQTCRSFNLDEIISRLGSRLYFLDDCHLYSVHDLCSVHDRSILSMLTKVVSLGTKHIYGCKLCLAKGFLCEICHNDKVIFPFETETTVQCFECKSVFHRGCKSETTDCPKCERRRKRVLQSMKEAEELYTSESEAERDE